MQLIEKNPENKMVPYLEIHSEMLGGITHWEWRMVEETSEQDENEVAAVPETNCKIGVLLKQNLPRPEVGNFEGVQVGYNEGIEGDSDDDIIEAGEMEQAEPNKII